MSEHICTKCGSENTTFKSGTSKAGKPYKGYKCSDCDAMDFVNDTFKPKPQVKPVTNGDDLKAKAMVLAYAKDLTVAKLNNRPDSMFDLGEETISLYLKLWEAIN